MKTLDLAAFRTWLAEIFAGRAAAAPVTRLLPWVPVAQVEAEGDGGFPVEQCLTAERLAAIAAAFDPRLYRPPVVAAAPGDLSPSHAAGERMPPLGWVAEQKFVYPFLWERHEEIVDPVQTLDGPDVSGPGRIQKRISDGYDKRSIAFWPGTQPDTPGGWRGRHTLLIAAEPEGQMGLPPLSDYFTAALGADGGRVAALPFAARTFPYSDDPQEEESPVTQEEIDKLVAGMAGRVAPMIEAAVAPIQAANLALTASITTLQNSLTAETAARVAAETAAVEGDLASRVAALSKEGRVPPGEVETELKALKALPVADRTARLAVLAGRSPLIPVVPTKVTIGAEQVELPPELANAGPLAGRLLEFQRENDKLPVAERTGPAAHARLVATLSGRT